MIERIKRFLERHKRVCIPWGVILLCFILVATYPLVYLAFKGDGPIPTGSGLNKNDWLAFLGAYLSFSGSLIVGAISLWQTKKLYKSQDERAESARRQEIQPMFSLSYDGCSSVGKLHITNLENVPIRNVFICDQYMLEYIEANGTACVPIKYYDSHTDSKATAFLELAADYPRNAARFPKHIIISYEDRDGNAMYQIFEPVHSNDKDYYVLDKIDVAATL